MPRKLDLSFLAALCIIYGFSGFAYGEHVDPDRFSAAVGAEQAMGEMTAFQKTLAAMRPSLIAVSVRNGNLSVESATKLVNTVILKSMKTQQEKLEAAKAQILAERFTIAELSEITRLYLSPLGRRLLAARSAVGTNTLEAMQPFLGNITPSNSAVLNNNPNINGAPQ